MLVTVDQLSLLALVGEYVLESVIFTCDPSLYTVFWPWSLSFLLKYLLLGINFQLGNLLGINFQLGLIKVFNREGPVTTEVDPHFHDPEGRAAPLQWLLLVLLCNTSCLSSL